MEIKALNMVSSVWLILVCRFSSGQTLFHVLVISFCLWWNFDHIWISVYQDAVSKTIQQRFIKEALNMLQFTMDDPAVHTQAFICQSSPLSHCVVAPLTRDARKELRPQVYQLLLQLTEGPSPQPWFCGLEEPRKSFLKKSKYFLEVSLSPVSGGESKFWQQWWFRSHRPEAMSVKYGASHNWFIKYFFP